MSCCKQWTGRKTRDFCTLFAAKTKSKISLLSWFAKTVFHIWISRAVEKVELICELCTLTKISQSPSSVCLKVILCNAKLADVKIQERKDQFCKTYHTNLELRYIFQSCSVLWPWPLLSCSRDTAYTVLETKPCVHSPYQSTLSITGVFTTGVINTWCGQRL